MFCSSLGFLALLACSASAFDNDRLATPQFPDGVLNRTWAANKTFLRKARKALKRGKAVAIHGFLDPSIAQLLAEHMHDLARRQNDEDQGGYPFKQFKEGAIYEPPRWQTVQHTQLCSKALADFESLRSRSFAYSGGLAWGRAGDNHASLQQAFQAAMQTPWVLQMWQNLTGMPSSAANFDMAWSWLREGDFYGLHPDHLPHRYLSVTIHLTSDWPSDGGGEFLWCGPSAKDDIVATIPMDASNDFEFRISSNGSYLHPSFNTAVVFPVSQASYHAIAPVRASRSKRFTIQGWYSDLSCELHPQSASCQAASNTFDAFAEHWSNHAERTQPILSMVAQVHSKIGQGFIPKCSEGAKGQCAISRSTSGDLVQ